MSLQLDSRWLRRSGKSWQTYTVQFVKIYSQCCLVIGGRQENTSPSAHLHPPSALNHDCGMPRPAQQRQWGRRSSQQRARPSVCMVMS